jgi:uncharacterized membrane protein
MPVAQTAPFPSHPLLWATPAFLIFSEVHMGLIIPLIIFVGFAAIAVAIIVWVADWASGARRYVALADLNRRLASGEIERTEYEEKRQSAGKIRRHQKRRHKTEEAA